MLIKSSVFVGSFTTVAQCPKADKPEYAFIGRSNVGKSSIINMLCERKALARVSNTPGKTQTINHFLINERWYLVDLPGYGYARISKTQRKAWQQFIRSYLNKRSNLHCVFLLIDARIPPQKIDLEFASWMGEMRIPFVIVFTKSDDKKYKPENIKVFKDSMLETWNDLPQMFLSSAKKQRGKEEILDFIHKINEQSEI